MPPSTAATVLTVAGAAVLGLMIGSFLNVVVYRSPRGMSVVRPGSSCPRCGTLLAARDNVPLLSWLWLRGRCRSCGAPISARYPIVEGLAGAAFAALAWAVGPAAALLPLLVVTAAAIAAAAIDHDRLAIPRAVTGAGLAGAGGLAVVSAAEHGGIRLAWGAAGAAVTVAALVGIAVLEPAGRRGGPEESGGAATVPLRPLASIAVLAWCAGWLWPPGGLVVAGWTALVVLATRAIHRVRTPLPAGADRHGGDPAAPRPARWLLVASAGAYWILVAGAAVNGP